MRRAAPPLSALKEESPIVAEAPRLQWMGALGVGPPAVEAAVEGEGEEDPWETTLPRRTSLGRGDLRTP